MLLADMRMTVTPAVWAALFLASSLLGMDASTEQPGNERVNELVRKLGDDSFAVRAEASKKLKALGRTALVALRVAADSEDPEVRNRALELLLLIEVAFSADEMKARQQKCAKALGVPVEREVDLGAGVKLHLMLIPPGEFTMGTNGDRNRVTPVRCMKIKRAFYMGKYEVTQAQYLQVMGENPSTFKQKADLPVESVSWVKAGEFCAKAGEKTGLALRLPTEAEWEYACRAGTRSAYYLGDQESDLQEVAWYAGNSGETTHSVGQKSPNAFGLYDMLGNVWEWCEDHWHASYNGAPADERAWVDAQQDSPRVIRGGTWKLNAALTRCDHRSGYNPSDQMGVLGFRVVAFVPESKP